MFLKVQTAIQTARSELEEYEQLASTVIDVGSIKDGSLLENTRTSLSALGRPAVIVALASWYGSFVLLLVTHVVRRLSFMVGVILKATSMDAWEEMPNHSHKLTIEMIFMNG